MAIRYPITLSTTEPNNNIGLLKIRQADEETQTLVVEILEHGVPLSYENLQVFFCAKIGQTEGLGIIEQKLLDSEMTDPKNGKLEYTMRAQDWQILGRQLAYFSFRKMTDDHTYVQQFTTRDFTYEVTKNVFSDGTRQIISDGSTYIWTIEDLKRLYEEYIASGKSDWEEFVEQNRDIIESVDPGGTVLSELIRSRKPEGYSNSFPDLPSRLDQQIGLNSDFRSFDTDKSFMLRVHTDFNEREINFNWFQPAGDGITDDTQAFKDCLSYCAQVKARKLMVPTCSNFYKVTDAIELTPENNGLKIEFSGDLGPVKLVSPTNRGHFLGILGLSDNEDDWVDGIEISNLTIETSYSKTEYPTGIDNPIGISRAKNIKLRNIHVMKSPWKGVSAQYYCKNIAFEDVFVENCYDYGIGVEFSTCENISLYRCQSHNNGKQGILVTAAGDGGFVRGVTVESCVTSKNGLEGVGLNYCDTPITKGNQSYENKGDGYKFRECVRASSQSDKAVTNNLAGFYILNGSYNTILNGDSRNNSVNDSNERGNVFFENSPNGQLLNTICNTGIRSLTNWSENLMVSGSVLAGTTKTALRTALAEQTERTTINADGTVEVRYGSVPTLGSWRRGDKVWTTTPLQGNTPGWICVANGSPGTWRAMGSLASS